MVDTYQKIYQIVVDAGGAKNGAEQIRQAMATITQATGQAATATQSLQRLETRLDALDQKLSLTADQKQLVSGLNLVAQTAQAAGKPIEAYAGTIDLLMQKYDAGTKAARQFSEAQASAIQAARQQQFAENAQANFNSVLGVNTIDTGAARASAAAFQEQIDLEDEAIAKAKAEEAAAQQLLSRFDQLGTARIKYAEAIKLADTALAAGIYNEEQYARVTAGLKTELDALTAAQTRASKAGGLFGLNNIGRMELQASAINFVQGISAGISPLRMLETEAPQVFGALIQGGTLTTATLLGVGGAIAGVAGGLGVLFLAYEKGLGQVNAFNAALKLTADASGMTAGKLDMMVQSVTKLGSISPTAARSIATAMTASGKLTSDVIAKLLEITPDFAKATGKDAEQAGAELTKMFSDPQQALKQLDDQYNLLSVSQRQHIQDLIAEGQKTQAQIELANALNDRFKNLSTDGMGFLEKTWTALGNAASWAWDKMLGIGRGQTLEQQLADVEGQIQKLQQQKSDQAGALIGQFLPFFGQKQLDQLNSQAADLQSQIKGANLDAQLAEQAAKMQQVGKDADTASQALDTFGAKQKQAAQDVQLWTNNVKDLEQAMLMAERPQDVAGLQKSLDLANAVLQAKQRQQAGLRSPEQEAADQIAIRRQVAAAPPTQRAALEARLTTQDQLLHDQSVLGSPDADRIIKSRTDAAVTSAIIQQTTAISDQNTQLNLNARLTLATGEAWMRSSAEGMAAAARQQAAIQALTEPINVNARTLQIINQQVNEAVTAGAQQVRSLQQQADAQARLDEAAKGGPLSEHQAEVTNAIAAATQDLNDKLELALSSGNTKAAADLKAEIAGIADAIHRADTSATSAAKSLQLFSSKEDLGFQRELLQTQINTVGADPAVQARTLAMAQATVEMERQHQDLTSKEVQDYIQQAGELADMQTQLEKNRAIVSELPDFASNFTDTLTQGFKQFVTGSGDLWSRFEQFGMSALENILDEELKLMVANPLKNWLAGNDNLPTINSQGLFSFLGGQGPAGTTAGASQAAGGLSGVASWFSNLFADGGIMTSRGRIPLRAYSGGGITASPQLALFGEGSTPEAFVPVPSGKIPVEMRMMQPAIGGGANDNRAPEIHNHFHFANKEAVDTFRRSQGQILHAASMAARRAAVRNG